jgi:signal peptidase I
MAGELPLAANRRIRDNRLLERPAYAKLFCLLIIRTEEAALEFRKSTIREYFESIVITAIIALFAITYVVQAYKIPTGSMENNLLIGDHLLVNKFVYGLHSGFLSKLLPYKEPKRGDVIVFKFPGETEVAYVKRLMGMPGDKIEMIGCTLYINDKPLKEDYTQYIYQGNSSTPKGPFYVEPGHYFAMGDNRDNSWDSRGWGDVPRDYLLGKALVIYWSFETPHGEWKQTGIWDRMRQYYDVFRNFFTKTRWRRTFTIIR